MGWDTEKFEEELEIYAKTQTPKMQDRIRAEYNRFMSGCGWPLELVAVGECDGIRIRVPKVKKKPESDVALVTPQAESVKPEKAAEAEEKEIPPETVPQTPAVSEPEKISESAKEPQAEATNTALKTTAYFTYPDANLFKKLFKAMAILPDEITWKINADSLVMRQMDPSRVALIDLAIEKEAFKEWEVTTSGYVSFNASKATWRTRTRNSLSDLVIGSISW